MNEPVFNKKKLYQIVVGDDSELGVQEIAFVNEPAIEVNWVAMSKQNKFQFAADKDRQLLAGPFLIPGKPIYRFSEELGDYWVEFSKETVEFIARRFNKQSRNQMLNLEHTDTRIDSYIAENWIVDDPEHDKASSYSFKDLPQGTWFGLVKVDDPTFWTEYVKEGKVRGFSVEGLLGLEKTFSALINQTLEDDVLAYINENTEELGVDPNDFELGEWTPLTEDDFKDQDPNSFAGKLTLYKYSGPLDAKTRMFCRQMLQLTSNKYLTRGDIQKLNARAGGYSVFKHLGGNNCRHHWERTIATVNDIVSKNLTYKKEMNKLKFEAEAKLADGTILFTPTSIEVGAELFTVDADGNQTPAPDGEHTMEDGTVLVVAEGKITEVKPKAELAEDAAVDNTEVLDALNEIRALLAEMDSRLTAIESSNPVEEVTEEMKKIKAEFEAFKKSPGGSFKTVTGTGDKPLTQEERFAANLNRIAEYRKAIG